jgi:hypothetical protein
LHSLSFPWLSTDTEVIWQGTVKIDSSMIKYMTAPIDEKNDSRLYNITDTKYGYDDTVQIDNIHGKLSFPNTVTIILKGELIEYMDCFAVNCHTLSKANGFLKKKYIKNTTLKGFILQPTVNENEIDSHACLAAIQFDNEEGKILSITHRGLLTLTSGSRTSNVTIGNPRKSVTMVFVSSDENPFVASMGIKKPSLKLTCGSTGLSKKKYLDKTQLASSQSSLITSTKEHSLEILNSRLSKGEITIEEYHKLKELLQNESNKSSFYWI